MSPFLQIFSSDARIFNKLAATTQADARIFNKLAAYCSIRKVPFLTNFLSKGPAAPRSLATRQGSGPPLSRLNLDSPLFLLK